ncbi:hypothetical protein [Paenibacillus sp. GbtcB18]|uniref:hypothetical protein n=1 Tax=Paenibacillus sp. GbtcB18 TaxID=2824763 RepID=UPI001C30CFA7|nr:hypothetical protein [Paenibacillus sp. GbtcB18]
MARYKYSVTVTDEAGSPYPIRHSEHTARNKAIEQAKNWAKEYSDKLVFIQFYRDIDGQVGYINPDGMDLVGRSWIDPEVVGSPVPEYVGPPYVAERLGKTPQYIRQAGLDALNPGYNGTMIRPDAMYGKSPAWLKSRFQGSDT